MSTCIFANMRISNNFRFEIFKKSYFSLSQVNFEKWYINIRGEHKKDAEIFLKSQLGSKLILFDLNSGDWHADSRIMFMNVNQKVIFYWVEDHLLQVDTSVLDKIHTQFLKTSCDYLNYSFWGLGAHYQEFSSIKKRNVLEHFDIIDYGKTENRARQKTALEIYGTKAYLVGLCVCSLTASLNRIYLISAYFL